MGGLGGSESEPGGPGTIYLHRLPWLENQMLIDGTNTDAIITANSNVTGDHTNRTLYIDNRYVHFRSNKITYSKLNLSATNKHELT